MSNFSIDSIAHVKDIVSLLRLANNRMSKELKTAQKENQDLKSSLLLTENFSDKLEKIDKLKFALKKLRTSNSQINIWNASVLPKVNFLQEKIFKLQEEYEQVQKEQSEIVGKRNKLTALRANILPKSKLLEIKNKLSKESLSLEKILKEVNRLSKEIPVFISTINSIKDEIKKISAIIPKTKASIDAMKMKMARILPKVRSKEDIKKLEDEISPLRKKKLSLTKEQKELSPKVAAIFEEEENNKSIIVAYKSKNQKDKDRLSGIKKELKEMNIDKNSTEKLKQKVLLAEEERIFKQKELEKLKAEYTGLLNFNQKYKAIIKEVEEDTQKLEQMIGNS